MQTIRLRKYHDTETFLVAVGKKKEITKSTDRVLQILAGAGIEQALAQKMVDATTERHADDAAQKFLQ